MTHSGDPPRIVRLTPADAQSFDAMLDLFAAAFEDTENYSTARPGSDYRKALLARDDFVALVAIADARVIGALVTYELRKFEQERSEFYIYDLAVSQEQRRKGVATALIAELGTIAKARGSASIYVQADLGDAPAVALYSKLGTREDVLHFDLSLDDP